VAPVAPILAELAEEDVDWLLATGERQPVPRGTVLIEAGVPAPALFVVDGVVGIETATPLTAQLGRRGPGELVGEISFVDSRPPSATVTALEDSVVYGLPREAVAAKLALDAGFSARTLAPMWSGHEPRSMRSLTTRRSTASISASVRFRQSGSRQRRTNASSRTS
jgi:CRP/FNR family cyclic AMP-dependent transcriptional regulator